VGQLNAREVRLAFATCAAATCTAVTRFAAVSRTDRLLLVDLLVDAKGLLDAV
jgi:hypothetical protein